jgi:hypothetical protein
MSMCGVRLLASAVGILSAAAAVHATNVCGPINANTTWTTAGSPYVLTCDVRVLSGATLTIDPGVVVQMQAGTSLVAEGGVIRAIGTGASNIRITSVDISNPGAGSRVQGGQIWAEYVVFSDLQSGVSLVCCGSPFNPPLRVDRCQFIGNQSGISGYTTPTSLISNSLFTNNGVAAGQAYQHYTNCQFQANTFGFNFAESITLEDCELSGHQIAVASPTGNSMVMRRCHVHGNQLGIERVPHIERCLIEFNDVGVRVGTGYLNFFQCNDIINNLTWNVEMQTGTTLSAPNNWFGSTSPAVIDAGIKDGFDQIGLGFFQYAPALAGPQATTSTCACTTPSFNLHPASQTVFSGNTATLTAGATAIGTPTYQWFKDNQPLSNSARFSGVNTPTLTISPVARQGSEPGWTDAGQYFCRATNVCGAADSNIAILTTPVCAADFNQSGIVSVQDIFDFLAAYFAGCP